jgi:hypothetical protein
MRSLSKRPLAAVLLPLFLALCARAAPAAPSPVLEILVSSPWLALLTNFIGGVNVKVSSILEWNEEGELTRRVRTRSLQSLPPKSLIMAFDYRDARGLGLSPDGYENYRSLYTRFPIDEDAFDASLSDPSVIPFVAQRALTVLADWDPDNYPYYQRRLAEFQARLYSTTLAGRQILRGQTVYDLTGHSGALLKAAGCLLIRPSEAEWGAWSAWKETDKLLSSVSRHLEEKNAVVVDASTPRAIRGLLGANHGVFAIARPKTDQDYPAFLHGQYISLWSKLTQKPLPAPRRGR